MNVEASIDLDIKKLADNLSNDISENIESQAK